MLRFMVSCFMLAVLNVACWAQGSLSLAAPAHGIPLKGAAAASKAVPTYNGIQYNGGAVMNQVNGVNVYFIWCVPVGTWRYSGEVTRSLIAPTSEGVSRDGDMRGQQD